MYKQTQYALISACVRYFEENKGSEFIGSRNPDRSHTHQYDHK